MSGWRRNLGNALGPLAPFRATREALVAFNHLTAEAFVRLGGARSVFARGSFARGDFVPFRSDLDLALVVDEPSVSDELEYLRAFSRPIDRLARCHPLVRDWWQVVLLEDELSVRARHWHRFENFPEWQTLAGSRPVPRFAARPTKELRLALLHRSFVRFKELCHRYFTGGGELSSTRAKAHSIYREFRSLDSAGPLVDAAEWIGLRPTRATLAAAPAFDALIASFRELDEMAGSLDENGASVQGLAYRRNPEVPPITGARLVFRGGSSLHVVVDSLEEQELSTITQKLLSLRKPFHLHTPRTLRLWPGRVRREVWQDDGTVPADQVTPHLREALIEQALLLPCQIRLAFRRKDTAEYLNWNAWEAKQTLESLTRGRLELPERSESDLRRDARSAIRLGRELSEASSEI